MKRFILISLIIGLCAGQSFAAMDPFINGSFEIGDDPGKSFSTLLAGSTAIDGWTVGNNGIDYISGYWKAADGSRSLDMSALNAGSISQTFDTVTGNNYLVTFQMAGNPVGGPLVKELTVGAAGKSQNFIFDTTGKSQTNMGWETMNFSFVANSSSTTLSFTSLINTACGPALDGVTVSLVPVPATILLGFIGLGVGGWKLRKSMK
ncbi:MAG: choice-of-anchor C family protein [Sedimentisphaerales bacterium]|nr:choice-of-anchor C family protein [Sedimentisphaerales bacterium]